MQRENHGLVWIYGFPEGLATLAIGYLQSTTVHIAGGSYRQSGPKVALHSCSRTQGGLRFRE